MSAGGYKVDGKLVRCWLFGAPLRLPNGRQLNQLVQVEAFDLDHAWKRLLEHPRFGAVRRSSWQMIDELAPEHDVGYLGEKLSLLPHILKAPLLKQ